MRQEVNNYAFIDSQNLNLGVRNNISYRGKRFYTGWHLDFKKFRRFLSDKYRVKKAFLFIGNSPGNEDLYGDLRRAGYILILKPTTQYVDSDGNKKIKGNVDTDLVLYAAAKEINNYDGAIIVSGDGDFLSPCDYLVDLGKLNKIVIPNKLSYSQLLKKYSGYFDFVSVNQKKLCKNKKDGYKSTGRTQ